MACTVDGKYHHTKFSVTGVCRVLIIILSIASAYSGLAGGQSREHKEVFALTVRGEPLTDVLDRVSEITGYRFSLDERWHDVPITADFVDVSLREGLKRILRGLDNAIVYGPDMTIRILVLGESDGVSATSGRMTAVPEPNVPIFPVESVHPVSTQQPDHTSAIDRETPEQPNATDQDAEKEAVADSPTDESTESGKASTTSPVHSTVNEIH